VACDRGKMTAYETRTWDVRCGWRGKVTWRGVMPWGSWPATADRVVGQRGGWGVLVGGGGVGGGFLLEKKAVGGVQCGGGLGGGR